MQIETLNQIGVAFMTGGLISFAYGFFNLNSFSKKEEQQAFVSFLTEQQEKNKLAKKQPQANSAPIAKQRLETAKKMQQMSPEDRANLIKINSFEDYQNQDLLTKNDDNDKEDKYAEVMELHKNGVDAAEIARQLKLGINEVNLLLTLKSR